MDSAMKNLVEAVRASHERQAIALCGAANTGKTHTLKKLVDWFREQDATIVSMRDMGNGLDELWAFDFHGVRIGIATGGDNHEMIAAAFAFFSDNDCTIVYCATRYRSDSSSWMEFRKGCSDKGFTVHWTSVTEIPAECQLAVNQAKARQLASAL